MFDSSLLKLEIKHLLPSIDRCVRPNRLLLVENVDILRRVCFKGTKCYHSCIIIYRKDKIEKVRLVQLIHSPET